MDSAYRYSVVHRHRPNDNQESFTTDWCPPDHRRNWDRFGSVSSKLGWTDSNIKYRFNKWGFRHDGDFVENKNSIVFLGCSMTFGVGVNYEQAWPYHVAKELGLDCINLGQPGTGLNASYRVAKLWLPVIKPAVVLWFSPSPHRRELWPTVEMLNDDQQEERKFADPVKSIGPWSQESDCAHKKYLNYFKMYTSKMETDIWEAAYMDAMRHLCRNTQYIQMPVTMMNTSPDKWVAQELLISKIGHHIQMKHDLEEARRMAEGVTPNQNTDEAIWARDMSHPGPKVHKNITAANWITEYNFRLKTNSFENNRTFDES